MIHVRSFYLVSASSSCACANMFLVLTCFRLLINEHKETNNKWEMLSLLLYFGVIRLEPFHYKNYQTSKTSLKYKDTVILFVK